MTFGSVVIRNIIDFPRGGIGICWLAGFVRRRGGFLMLVFVGGVVRGVILGSWVFWWIGYCFSFCFGVSVAFPAWRLSTLLVWVFWRALLVVGLVFWFLVSAAYRRFLSVLSFVATQHAISFLYHRCLFLYVAPSLVHGV